VDGLVVLGQIRLAQGDRSGAVAAIEEAATVLPEAGDRRVPIGARRAELAFVLGDVDAAADWIRGRGVSVGDEPIYPRDGEHRLLARVLIARGDARSAVPMLDRWRALAAAQGRTGVRLEQMAGTAGLPRAFLGQLAAAFDRQGTPVLPAARPGATAVPGLLEPLSAREQEVLGLIAAGRPNRAIAAELYIGVDTVKRHVSHVFAKLGVANRTEAVARARALGLLD
jgi:LuxR family maltose regulon positive regulatory protein